MKIIHACLSCFYIDGYSYQENELVSRNVRDGHDVVVIASTESYSTDGNLVYLSPSEYHGSDGARVIRIPYVPFFPLLLARKIRAYEGFYESLEREAPDVILFHGLCSWELLTIKKYKKNFPKTRIYIDSHTDRNNSARGFISRNILHGVYYKNIIHSTIDVFEKILCISQEVLNFARDIYEIPIHKLEFFPLGGEIVSDAEYYDLRISERSKFNIRQNDVLFVQTGKIDKAKKLIESIKAFSRIEGDEFRFIIAGVLKEDVKGEVSDLISDDPRILFAGWKSASELRTLLCAADFYIQPGSQSSTMQMSLCCRCAIILSDVVSHAPYHDKNGWLVGGGISLEEAFFQACKASREEIENMSTASLEVAKRLLDYRVLASRIYE